MRQSALVFDRRGLRAASVHRPLPDGCLLFSRTAVTKGPQHVSHSRLPEPTRSKTTTQTNCFLATGAQRTAARPTDGSCSMDRLPRSYRTAFLPLNGFQTVHRSTAYRSTAYGSAFRGRTSDRFCRRPRWQFYRRAVISVSSLACHHRRPAWHHRTRLPRVDRPRPLRRLIPADPRHFLHTWRFLHPRQFGVSKPPRVSRLGPSRVHASRRPPVDALGAFAKRPPVVWRHSRRPGARTARASSVWPTSGSGQAYSWRTHTHGAPHHARGKASTGPGNARRFMKHSTHAQIRVPADMPYSRTCRTCGHAGPAEHGDVPDPRTRRSAEHGDAPDPGTHEQYDHGIHVPNPTSLQLRPGGILLNSRLRGDTHWVGLRRACLVGCVRVSMWRGNSGGTARGERAPRCVDDGNLSWSDRNRPGG